jgi:hypothetical protein
VQKSLSSLNTLNSPVSVKLNSPVSVSLSAFVWSAKGEEAKDIIPFGTFRNHLFDKICAVSSNLADSCKFISMDGDTTLTPKVAGQLLSLQDDAFTTVSYNIPKETRDINKSITDAFKLHWVVQSQVHYKPDGSDKEVSLAYPAEPCLIIGSEGFKTLRTLRGDGEKIYGETDCEGRYLTRYLQQAGQHFAPVALPKKGTAYFHNFTRFAIKDIGENAGADRWLSAMARQSQNMSGVDFFARQLSFGLGIRSTQVAKAAAQVYVPNLLRNGYSLDDALKTLNRLSDKDATETALYSQIAPEFNRIINSIDSTYGSTVSQAVQANTIRWAKASVSFASKQYPQAGNSATATEHSRAPEPQRARQESAAVHTLKRPPQYSLYNRQNKMARLAAYPAAVGVSSHSAMALQDTGAVQPALHTASLDGKIPRKRPAAPASLESTPVMQTLDQAIPRKRRTENAESTALPHVAVAHQSQNRSLSPLSDQSENTSNSAQAETSGSSRLNPLIARLFADHPIVEQFIDYCSEEEERAAFLDDLAQDIDAGYVRSLHDAIKKIERTFWVKLNI